MFQIHIPKNKYKEINDALNIETLLEASNSINTTSLEEKVKLLIIRDLIRLNWKVQFLRNKIEIKPPAFYDKDTIRKAMSIKRDEIIAKNKRWIIDHKDIFSKNMINGIDILEAKIDPIIEVCETQEQLNIFRAFRYYWSSPYSDYVGRRIKLLIRDKSIKNKPIIGIAALGSSIIHIPDRDKYIGWDKNIRTKNLINTMDAYVIGAIPPYNYILGGKLISYLLCSNEVRKIFKEKYKDKVTKISKRVSNDLACIFTTGLYGQSSQYNRLKYDSNLLYKHIGYTKGYGTLHLTNETLEAMRELLIIKDKTEHYNFGDGPSWTMRLIRRAGEILGFDGNFLLKHSFQRSIYIVPLAKNYKEFLNEKEFKLQYFNLSKKKLVQHWKNRWYSRRSKRSDILQKIISFSKENFYKEILSD